MPFLPVTPQPYPEESIFSWAVRLAESNMVPSPWHVFKLVGFNQQEMKTPTLDTSRLWHLISDDNSVLEPFRYACNSAAGIIYSFRGQPVTVRDLAPMSPKICPECVKEYGYASAHWDLELVTCCHIHRLRLVAHCPDCCQKITWFRSDLLTCPCGGLFTEAPADSVSPDEAALNQLIYNVAFGKPAHPDEANPAIRALSKAPLQYLLRFATAIGTLSTQGRLVRDKKNRVAVTTLISAAAEVISSWPENFHTFLWQLATRPPRVTQERFGVLGCINDFSTAMLERTDDQEHGSFCRSELRKFLAHSWDGPLDARVVRALNSDGLTPKWISLSLAAEQLEVDKRTLTLIMNRGLIEHKTVTASSANRILLRTEDLKPEWFAKTELLNIREASEQLGLPVSVLQELRSSGEYVQTYFGANSISYAQRDVSKLKEAILSGKHYIPADQHHGVSIATAMKMKFRNSSAKAEILRAIIRGDIRSVAARPEKLGELLLHPNDLEAFIERVTLPGNGSMSEKQAGVAIHTTKEIVKYLVENGYLSRHENGEVDAASVRAFIDSYVCLNTLLSHRKDKIARAEQMCAQQSVDLIALEGQQNGSTRRFLKKSDVPLLKELVMKRPTRSSLWSMQ